MVNIGTILTILFRKKMAHLIKTLFLFDTVGPGVFTIIGTKIGIT